jgi:hypothetical protein
MTTFALKDVKPNPFRRTEKYPLIPGKVEFLKTSIENTDFWENIVGREVDGELEIAYGHHRLAALKDLFPGTQKFDWRIKKLSDAKMIQIMAAENDDAYSCDPRALIESVRATVQAYAAGKITEKEMPAHGKDTPNSSLRYAPSFVMGQVPPSGAEGRSYSAVSLGKFLGLTKGNKRDGEQAATRLLTVLNALELNELGFLSDSILANCSTINSLEASMRQKDPLDVDVRSAIEKRDIKRAMEATKARQKEEAAREKEKVEKARAAAEVKIEHKAEIEEELRLKAEAAEKAAAEKERLEKEARATAKKKRDEDLQRAVQEAKRVADKYREIAEVAEAKRKKAEAATKAEEAKALAAAEEKRKKKEAEDNKRLLEERAATLLRQKEETAKEKEKREAERKVRIRKLMGGIAKAGYEILHQKLSPERGGSNELRAELKEAFGRIKDWLVEVEKEETR